MSPDAQPGGDAEPDGPPLRLRWSARSEVGLVREGNEDSGYAGVRLLAVADGMGGMVAGDVASNLTVGVLRRLDDAVAHDVIAALRAAVLGANDRLRVAVQADPGLEGMGTTVTALLWDGRILGLAHIGDSRGYLLRDGRLERLTHDHTFVQSLIDEGRLTDAEARVHPHRSLLLRALDGRADVELDVARLEIVDGDRFLICSDGLCGYVDDEAIAVALARPGRDDAVNGLVELAMLAGGVDNVTCLVADVVVVGSPADAVGDHGLAGTTGTDTTSTTTTGTDTTSTTGTGSGSVRVGAVLIGAAAVEPAVSAEVAEALARSSEDSREGVDPGDGEDGADGVPSVPGDAEEIRYALLDPRRSRWFGRILVVVVALVVVLVATQQAWAWTQRQYYVGAHDGHVTIYRGLSASLLGVSLSSVHSIDDDLSVDSLPPYYQQRVESSLSSGDLANAEGVVAMLTAIADHCRTVSTDQQCRSNAPLLTTPPPVPTTGAPPPATSPATAISSPGVTSSPRATRPAVPPTPVRTGRRAPSAHPSSVRGTPRVSRRPSPKSAAGVPDSTGGVR